MMHSLHNHSRLIPTAMSGLALGIASLGMSWENLADTGGELQLLGAVIAGAMLLAWLIKFILHPKSLWQELSHPVVGSVVPTFSMATMVISKSLPQAIEGWVWSIAVVAHLGFLAAFVWHRTREFRLHHMVPSWFVPPVGIIVAAVTTPDIEFLAFSQELFWFGLVNYLLMLPVMINRLVFSEEIPDGAKPTIAILAAPASLSLLGYVTVIDQPNHLLIYLLLGIALLMTAVIYLALFKLLKLPFTPAYAAFTFPMVIGATALFKVAALFVQWGDVQGANTLTRIAVVELMVATAVVGYVAWRYLSCFLGWCLSAKPEVA